MTPSYPDRSTGTAASDTGTGTVPAADLRPPAAADPLPHVPGYDLLHKLGEGGMGDVYLAQHGVMRRTVALKVLKAKGGTAGEGRFRAEAEALGRLDHPGVVRVFDVGEAGGHPYLAMEYVPGGRLTDRLRSGLPTFPETARLVEAIARAVHAAHQAHIIHRDLKPQNVLLDADGRPKVADFGLAKLRDASGADLTRTVAVMGTPAYMAPEQAAGRTRAATEATDVYGLGAVLYECLTGRPPFEGEDTEDVLAKVVETEPDPPRRVRPEVPRELEAVCLRCLEKTPGWRYPTAEALADDLAKFAAGEPVADRRPGRLRRLFGCRSRGRLQAFALAALVASWSFAGIAYYATRRPAGTRHLATVPVANPGPAVDPRLVADPRQTDALRQAVGAVLCSFTKPGPDGDPQPASAWSTAFAVSPDGDFLTARHNVEGVWRQLRNRRPGDPPPAVRIGVEDRTEPAEIRYVSDTFDLAVVRVNRPTPRFFRLGDANRYRETDRVFAAGFAPLGPKGGRPTMLVKVGEIASHLTDPATGAARVFHTARAEPGFSGGPVFTEDGTAVGINVAVHTRPDGTLALPLTGPRAEIEKHVPGAVWR